jgi:hypothetical protein
LALTPNVLDDALAGLRSEFHAPTDIEVAALQADIRELGSQQESLLDGTQYAADSTSRQCIAERLGLVAAAVEEKNKLIAAVPERQPTWGQVERKLDEILETYRSLVCLEFPTYEQRRRVIRLLAVRAKVWLPSVWS